jgi:hypothetical protein
MVRAPDKARRVCAGHRRAQKRLAVWLFETNGTEKDVILKNEPERLLKINGG